MCPRTTRRASTWFHRKQLVTASRWGRYSVNWCCCS